MTKRIIVPTDFSKAAAAAITQAIMIARKSASAITLFHVLNEKAEKMAIVSDKLKAQAATIHKDSGIVCEVVVKEGGLLESIESVVSERQFDLMVIGTHGFMGIRQKLFGADILKLVARLPLPVLVVQKDSPVADPFRKVILPISSHDNFSRAVDAILLFAGMYDIEVHLYSIQKPGFEWNDQMLANISYATKTFEEKGVRMVRIREDQEGSSYGYARQTLKYAHGAGADVMCMMSVASREYYSFARAYKETVLLNEFCLPVLCAGGGSGD
ncbi:MAG: universal stress protein [Bacteroidota bacterium]